MSGVTPERPEITHGLIRPYHGKLISLVVDREQRNELAERANKLSSVRLSPRSLCDLELLSTGAFSPLDRFMGQEDYTKVLDEMRLANGTLFPIPLTLPVRDTSSIRLGDEVALRSPNNDLLAVVTVEEMFAWDRAKEASLVLGTTDVRHPLVAEMASWGRTCLSGPLKTLNLPKHYDFGELRKTPAQVREMLQGLGTSNVVAFQPWGAIDRPLQDLTQRAAAEVDGVLLIQPIVGLIKPGDVDHYRRVCDYRALLEWHYDKKRTVLSLLPLAMRMAGPREALWHAIIRRNYGANYLMLGPDYADPDKDSQARGFYEHHNAQKLLQQLGAEVGVRTRSFDELTSRRDDDRIEQKNGAIVNTQTAFPSGTRARAGYFDDGTLFPEWCRSPTEPMLSQAPLSHHQQGFCVWFTGLSGAGKSTLAEILTVLLMEHGRAVTLLDGDVVRTHLSKELGFSKEDRDTNVLRIGFVASEIVRHHGVVVCAAVSPYRAARIQCRHMVGDDHFIEIFVDTPLEVRKRRDTKGMYAQACREEVIGFSGVSDSYEKPLHPEIRLTTADHSPEEDAHRIISYLIDRGFLLQDC